MANPTRTAKRPPAPTGKSKTTKPTKSAAKPGQPARPAGKTAKPAAGKAAARPSGAGARPGGKKASAGKKPSKAGKANAVAAKKAPAAASARPVGARQKAIPAGKAARKTSAPSNHASAGLSAADAEMVADLLPHLRAICLALPDATEVEAWGHPTFRVNNKIFASYGVEGARASMGVKTTPDMQSALVMSDPRFTVAAYVGQHGWVQLSLAGTVDLGEVEQLVHGSYRLVAPARLVQQLDRASK